MMTRYDLFNELIALYESTHEICAALRYARKYSGTENGRARCAELQKWHWPKAMPIPPAGKENSRYSFWGEYRDRLIWPRAFGAAKMSDAKASSLAEWLHSHRNGRKASEIKPLFVPVVVLPQPATQK